MSTTQVYPNNSGGRALPNSIFSKNPGPDATVVYNGPVSLSSNGCAAPGPCPFDMFLPLSAPFSFDPAKGRLLIDIISSSAPVTVSGSLDGEGFQDPTTSNVATVIGDPEKSNGVVATSGAVLGLESDTPCGVTKSSYPCTVGGTLLVTDAPAGNLFNGGGGGGGGGGGNTSTMLINDAQSPGFSLTGRSGALLESPGPAAATFNGTLDVASLSGAATINGGRASITCGVTGNATATFVVRTANASTSLACPKTSSPGIATTVFGQSSITPASIVVIDIQLTISLPSINDSVTLKGFSLQTSFVSNGPTILADSTGVFNGGSYRPGEIVSGSWVSVKGSGFTDPGKTVDWSKSDFSKGLPTSLNGVQVLFNGLPGAMWYLIDGAEQQINVQAPANLNGPVSVQVIRDKNASNILTSTAVPVSPGIFSYTLDGGQTFIPSAVFPDGVYLGDPAVFPGARKAKAGDVLSIFVNSLAVSPAGVVSVSAATHPVTVTIGTTSFGADFSGLVAPGEFQINFTVPRLPTSGNLPITIQIDGQSSQDGVVFPFSN